MLLLSLVLFIFTSPPLLSLSLSLFSLFLILSPFKYSFILNRWHLSQFPSLSLFLALFFCMVLHYSLSLVTILLSFISSSSELPTSTTPSYICLYLYYLKLSIHLYIYSFYLSLSLYLSSISLHIFSHFCCSHNHFFSLYIDISIHFLFLYLSLHSFSPYLSISLSVSLWFSYFTLKNLAVQLLYCCHIFFLIYFHRQLPTSTSTTNLLLNICIDVLKRKYFRTSQNHSCYTLTDMNTQIHLCKILLAFIFKLNI